MICKDPRRALSLLGTEFLAGFFCPPGSREESVMSKKDPPPAVALHSVFVRDHRRLSKFSISLSLLLSFSPFLPNAL